MQVYSFKGENEQCTAKPIAYMVPSAAILGTSNLVHKSLGLTYPRYLQLDP